MHFFSFRGIQSQHTKKTRRNATKLNQKTRERAQVKTATETTPAITRPTETRAPHPHHTERKRTPARSLAFLLSRTNAMLAQRLLSGLLRVYKVSALTFFKKAESRSFAHRSFINTFQGLSLPSSLLFLRHHRNPDTPVKQIESRNGVRSRLGRTKAQTRPFRGQERHQRPLFAKETPLRTNSLLRRKSQ